MRYTIRKETRGAGVSKSIGKRYPLNMRTTKEVREQLELAAAESGRSLVQEVEQRIQTSLQDDFILRGIGGPNSAAVLRPILFFFGLLDAKGVNHGWKNKPDVAEAIRLAVSFIVEAATAEEPLSSQRVQSFMHLAWPDDSNDRGSKRIDPIVTTAALTAQTFGLTEGMLSGEKRTKLRKDSQPIKSSGVVLKKGGERRFKTGSDPTKKRS